MVKTAKKAAAASPALDVGAVAPTFKLPGDLAEELSLKDFQGKKYVVLYFYPKDDTPGCTKEACAFEKDLKKLGAAGAVVVGISPDPVAKHARFRLKYDLSFPLVSDEGAKVARKYGVWVEKNLYGRRYMGIQRATFLIDKKGRIAAVWPKVKVDGHAREVLAALSAL